MRFAFVSGSLLLALMLAVGQFLPANRTHAASESQSSAAEGAAQTQPTPFKPEELEQIVAPIALYSDALLAQIFMASTYPLEIVQAARWSKEHPDVKGDAVATAVEQQPWDASVKSLVAFPDVLTMMNEKIDWTQKLGDAFLAQQKDVMDAVQRLRAKAKDAGNLRSTKEQTVKTEAAPAGAATPQIIVIESGNPEVVYVPTYNPTVVYGAWPYPAYPPYYYYPPAYVPGAALFSFSVGVAVGGALWGNCNWGHSDVDIDINRYNNFNRTEINNNRNTNIGNRTNSNSGKWQHNSEHRQGVGYRDAATQQKYGRTASRQGMQSREEFRGRAEQGRQEISRQDVGNQRDLGGGQARSSAGSQSGDMGSAATRRDPGGAQDRDRNAASYSRSSDAFSGVGNGASTRAQSNRGSASRGGGARRR